MANNTSDDELRGKIVRCFLNDAKGAVITPGVLENIVSLIKQEAERHTDAVIGVDEEPDISRRTRDPKTFEMPFVKDYSLRARVINERLSEQRNSNHYPLNQETK